MKKRQFIQLAFISLIVIVSMVYYSQSKINKIKKACDGGDAKSCTELGGMYYKGEGVSQDNAKAVQLFKKGCDGGNALGCSNLGGMYYKSEGVS